MAPAGDGTADVVIIEGAESIRQGAVAEGILLLSNGNARRIIVVIHQLSEKEKPFALDEDYPDVVGMKLKALGLKDHQFTVMAVPVHHPITLAEATAVMERLSKEGVRSAFLLAKGFHTRRSFLVYQHMGKLEIKIIPVAYFDDYRIDDWWRHDEGWREFASEIFKLVYYQARGYIPFKLSY
jgi:hypothetical protein